MSYKENLSWKLNLLEAQSETGAAMLKAKSIIEKKKRLALKKERNSSKGLSSENQDKNINSSNMENISNDPGASIEELRKVRIQKANQKIELDLDKLSEKIFYNAFKDNEKLIDFALELKVTDLSINEDSQATTSSSSENRLGSDDKSAENKKKYNNQQKAIKFLIATKPVSDCLKELDTVAMILQGIRKQTVPAKSQEEELKKKMSSRFVDSLGGGASDKEYSDISINSDLDADDYSMGSRSDYDSRSDYGSNYNSNSDFSSDSESDDNLNVKKKQRKLTVEELQVKKNRKGQRQRRMEYERIHGAEAKHIKENARVSVRKNNTKFARYRKPIPGIDDIREPKVRADSRSNKFASSSPFGSNPQSINYGGERGIKSIEGNQQYNDNYQQKTTGFSSNQHSSGSNFNNANAENLHPSWVAKQNERMKLAQINSGNFKGNKIVFGQDGESSSKNDDRSGGYKASNNANTSYNKQEYVGNHRQPDFTNKNNSGSENLHPSWVAKQNERMKLAQINSGNFKGNKIVFGQDGESTPKNNDRPSNHGSSNNSNTPYNKQESGGNYNRGNVRQPEFKNKSNFSTENLHPSWAAKQNERLKLAQINSGQSKGKKIVFD
ncbi:hypothetical protein AYI69_g7805 [Smittium culicis]|uniref:Bud22 domain-containing protein n=1 Tax=Smittium culicis TaxID=133412 RepID=A0A1R1XPI5_9FUNG|nr:hypothetical protein AYI69_g7805 [Smittium culicis]